MYVLASTGRVCVATVVCIVHCMGVWGLFLVQTVWHWIYDTLCGFTVCNVCWYEGVGNACVYGAEVGVQRRVYFHICMYWSLDGRAVSLAVGSSQCTGVWVSVSTFRKGMHDIVLNRRMYASMEVFANANFHVVDGESCCVACGGWNLGQVQICAPM